MTPVCPRCGKSSPANARFCIHDGLPLTSERAAEDRLQVQLDPTRIVLEPGREATCTVAVRSVGELVGRFVVRVQGPTAPYSRLTPDEVRLRPGSQATVELRFALPRGSEPAAGDLPVLLDLVRGDVAVVVGQGEGVLEVRPYRELAARVVPSRARARREAGYRVEVQNRGNVPERLRLKGVDPDDALIVAVAPPELALANGAVDRTHAQVRARDRRVWGRPLERPFAVVVESEDASPLEREARLVHRALFTARGVLLFLLALALVAGAVVLAFAD